MVFGPFSAVFSTTKPLPDFVRHPVMVCSFGAFPSCRASTVRAKAKAKAPDTINVATIEPLLAPPASNVGSPGYYHFDAVLYFDIPRYVPHGRGKRGLRLRGRF